MGKKSKPADSDYNKGSRSTKTQPRVTATLVDVAKRAGVSTASVSRVLNSPDKVSPSIQTRVETAIKELGYIPHGAAQALASRRSRIVGAIVPTLDNAIFAKGVNALQKRLMEMGYTLLIACSGYDPTEELQDTHALIRRGVEGMMLVGETHEPELYQLLDGLSIPFVNCWYFNEAAEYSCIGFDNHAAAMRVTEYLLDLGHRDVAMVVGITIHNDRARARVAGVREALAVRGLSLLPERLVERPYEIREGREALRILLRKRNAPTAVICGNDVLAYGVLLECQSAGIAVPGEISITGFADLPLSAHLQPPLTTVHVPSPEMGLLAAEYLVACISGQTGVAHKEVEVRLVVRGTTAPPRPKTLLARDKSNRSIVN